MSKLGFHLQTIRLMQAEVHDDKQIYEEFENAYDSIAHMAPEILDQAWRKIFNVCASRLTNMEIPSHKKCKQIYDERIPLYKTQFL